MFFLLTLSSAKNKDEKGIQFKDVNMEEGLELAAKEGKILFVDLFTSW